MFSAFAGLPSVGKQFPRENIVVFREYKLYKSLQPIEPIWLREALFRMYLRTVWAKCQQHHAKTHKGLPKLLQYILKVDIFIAIQPIAFKTFHLKPQMWTSLWC